MDILNGKLLILGSKSPRRSSLLKTSNIPHIIRSIEVEETYPEGLTYLDIPIYLSELKASVHTPLENEIILTSDTIVVFENRVLGKPVNRDQAIEFLKLLSNNSHEVITGFVLKSKDRSYSEAVVSKVKMSRISSEELNYYVDNFKPFDKAGSYGIQEWIGHTKIDEIQGSYNNIMGLPTQAVYNALKMFCE